MKFWIGVVLWCAVVLIVIMAFLFAGILNESYLNDSYGNNSLSEGNGTQIDFECFTDSYNCGDFDTQAEAQAVYDECARVNTENVDVHNMDNDGDGVVCEGLG